METATILAPSQTIRHPSIGAAVKAASLFSGRGRGTPDRLKAVSVTTGGGATAVESGCTDHSCRIELHGDDAGSPTSFALDEIGARAVARMDGDSVRLTRNEWGRLNVGIGGVTMPAGGDPGEVLRLDPPAGETRTVAIPWRAWCAAESSIVPATDLESSRYAIGAVLIQTAEGRGYFVGTDGRRLHAMAAPVRGDEGTSLILGPVWGKVRKAVETVARSTTGLTGRRLAAALADTAVSVTTDGTRLRIVWTDGAAVVAVTTTETQGLFPRWKDVFPNIPDAKVCTFDAGTLRAELMAAAAVTTEQRRGVTFRREAGGAAELTAGTGALTYRGPLSGDVPSSVHVTLDPRYVRDAIDGASEVMPGAPLVVQTTCRQSAVIFRVGAGLDADEYGFAAVIMPLGAED